MMGWLGGQRTWNWFAEELVTHKVFMIDIGSKRNFDVTQDILTQSSRQAKMIEPGLIYTSTLILLIFPQIKPNEPF